MNGKTGFAVAVGVGALVMVVIAAKKATPAVAAGDPSKTPNSVSNSEWVPQYSTLVGVGGLTPVVSFPDIGGTSANVTQPV